MSRPSALIFIVAPVTRSSSLSRQSHCHLSWKCRQHVATCRHDMTFRSNFGQMGPCRRHDIEDVVAVCVGLSRHLPDFPKCVCRNILWYGSTYTKKNRHNAHPTSTGKKRENTHYSFTIRCTPSSSAHATYQRHHNQLATTLARAYGQGIVWRLASTYL